MSNLIIPERLAALDSLDLLSGGHDAEQAGKDMCVMEAAAYVAGEPHTDHPKCVSPVLTSYLIRLNDRWDDEKRQQLKDYIPRIIGTAGDGQDEARLRIARTFLTGTAAAAAALAAIWAPGSWWQWLLTALLLVVAAGVLDSSGPAGPPDTG